MFVGGVVDYVMWAWLGGLAHLLVMKVWDEKSYLVREFGLATIVGLLIYYFNLPNSLTAFGIAFMGVDTIEAFLRRITGRINVGS